MSIGGSQSPHRSGGARRRRSVGAGLLVVALVALAGCSYSFSRSSLPTHIRTVAVPVLDNETVEPLLGEELTRAIASQFVNDGTLRVLPEGEADAAVYGAVTGYINRVFGYNANLQTEEYEVIIVLSVEFKDMVKRKTLWKADDMTARATYSVVGTTAEDEVSGRESAIERLARDIVDRTVRSWS